MAQVCGADVALRDELTSLLRAHDSAAGGLDRLAANVVAPAYSQMLDSVRAPDSALVTRLQAALGSSYRIEGEIGGGSISRVFLAEEVRLGRKVVIKVLPPELAETTSAERFRREIQLAAHLQHPHIVPLLTSDSAAGLLYYTMPYVAGDSLRARLARDGRVPAPDAILLWRDVLDALSYAHASGVVHRDVKPANILLSGRSALVTDFGIARAIEAATGDVQTTATGLSIGTPAYMSPEQAANEPVDHRTDIYAAGLVMYEMLEGRLPFAGDTAGEIARARIAGEAVPPTDPAWPPAVKELVMRCLASDPADRPTGAEEVLAALDAAAIQGTAARAPVAEPRAWFARLRRHTQVGAVALAVAAGTLAIAATIRREPAVDAGAALPAVAVLPLEYAGTDETGAALTNGLTEELTAILARVNNIRIFGGTSVQGLRERRLTVQQIAESLRVSFLLEGTVQRAGERLRMQVRLLEASGGSTLWARTYDRQVEDILTVQEEIAHAIAGELNVRLVGTSHQGSLRRRHYPNIAAYESYLRGMDLMLRPTRARLQQARTHYLRAIQVDSGFAAAHAALAWVYILRAGEAPGDHSGWYSRAQEAALRAVALDDSLAEAHAALGWAHLAERNPDAAEAALRRAIDLDPRALRAYEGLARVYLYTGRASEQLAAARAAIELEPFSPNAIRELAFALHANNRCEDALPMLRPLKSLDQPFAPAGIISGLCHVQRGDWPRAITEARWTVERTSARFGPAFLGYVLARAGEYNEARAILDDMLAGRVNSHGAFGIAIVYAGLGDHDQAFTWLERAAEENSIRVYLLDPAFAALHRDPRFAGVKQRMGL